MVADHIRRIRVWLILIWAAIGFWLSMSGYKHFAWIFVLLIPLTMAVASLWALHLQEKSKQDRA